VCSECSSEPRADPAQCPNTERTVIMTIEPLELMPKLPGHDVTLSLRQQGRPTTMLPTSSAGECPAKKFTGRRCD